MAAASADALVLGACYVHWAEAGDEEYADKCLAGIPANTADQENGSTMRKLSAETTVKQSNEQQISKLGGTATAT